MIEALREAPRGYYAAVCVGGREKVATSSRVKAVRVGPPTGFEGLREGAEFAEREGLALIVALRNRWGGPVLEASKLEHLLPEFRSVPVVLSGVSYWETTWLITKVSGLPHVHVETSMFNQMECLRLLVDWLGASRVLFGTGYPLQSPCVAVLKLLFSGLNRAEAEAVAWGNAARVFQLD